MEQIEKLNELFFSANKIYHRPLKVHTTEGYPGTQNDPIFYEKYEKDWMFRTYKEVVFAGMVWTRKLFNTPLTNLRVNKFEHGRKKQWFNVQIVKTGAGIIIDGESYNPFVNISYSYNTVHSIKFEIGFYRSACENGMVSGFKDLVKLKITPENLFEIPFWLNPCLLLMLSDRYEYQIKVLKNTSIKGEEIKNFVNQKLPKWKINNHMIDRYVDEMGANGFSLLNILTDAASNFDEGAHQGHANDLKFVETENFDHTSNSERATRQRKVGQFLERLIEEIEKENEITQKIDINSPEFKLTTENVELLEERVVKEKYRFNISKMKF